MGLSSIMDFSVYIWILPFCLQTKKNYDLETKLFVSCVLKKLDLREHPVMNVLLCLCSCYFSFLLTYILSK